MKKNLTRSLLGWKLHKPLLVVKLTFILIVMSMLQLSASVYSQNTKINLELKNITLVEVFQEIRNNSEFTFVYDLEDVEHIGNLSLVYVETSVEDILNDCLKNTNLTYEVVDKVIIVKEKPYVAPEPAVQQKKKVIKGKVTGEDGLPMVGVSVVVKGTYSGVTTNIDGIFSMTVDTDKKVFLEFSFIGMQKKSVEFKGEKLLSIVLKESAEGIDEVVVMGYFEKSKESFTGTAVTVSSEDILNVSSSNLIQALQVFDPSFKIMENTDFGSDPNSMPNFEIRGQSSLPSNLSESDLRSNPNRPTFILDGFEVNLEKIFDLDINLIESVSILKDAAATAIYGSRAANGVVVVSTKRPKAGKMRVSYTGSAKIEIPDLSDYNLLNAKDKLEAERLAGLYDSPSRSMFDQGELDKIYNDNLYNINKGVDTYWLSKPLEVSLSQKHSLYLSGGDDKFTYGVNLGYDNTKGVMIGAKRDRYALSAQFQYRIKNFTFRNNLQVNSVNSKDSPYGDYSTYARLNPYFPLKDEYGEYNYYLGASPLGNNGKEHYSPVYEALMLNNKSTKNYTEVRNNFEINWQILEGLRLKGKVSVSKKSTESEKFISPDHQSFKYFPNERKGEYSVSNLSSLSTEGDLTLSYYNTFGLHLINVNLGANLQQSNAQSTGFTGTGFVHDKLNYVSWASQFKENSRPSGSESLSRLAGGFFNLSYTYDQKYLMDFSSRLDGSSKFGKLQRTAPFWSLGLGWNIHKESFLKDSEVINSLRIKGNLGTTGSTSFNAYQALTKYQYISRERYVNMVGGTIMDIGNENLKWQTTFMKNIGFESAFFKNRFRLNANIYENVTKDLLTDITIAPSTGFISYKSNLGSVSNKGIELTVNGTPYRNKEKGINVSLFANVRHNENEIVKISDALKAYNDRIIEYQNDQRDDGPSNFTKSATLGALLYKEGGSLYDIYAVRSLGIDPVSGKEILLKKDGTKTTEWDANDQEVVGNSSPDFEGSFGGNIDYGNFSLNFSFSYQYGGQVYNSTLINRVENANIFDNVDERVYLDRWKNPGDLVFFKDIKDRERTLATSRFVQNENFLNFNSLKLSYKMKPEAAKKIGMSSVKFSVLTNDIARISTVKRERGLYYPFARTATFQIRASF